jgi:hypothetical protein
MRMVFEPHMRVFDAGQTGVYVDEPMRIDSMAARTPKPDDDVARSRPRTHLSA